MPGQTGAEQTDTVTVAMDFMIADPVTYLQSQQDGKHRPDHCVAIEGETVKKCREQQITVVIHAPYEKVQTKHEKTGGHIGIQCPTTGHDVPGTDA